MEFFVDLEQRLWIKCPHDAEYFCLPNTLWTVTFDEFTDALNVTPSINKIDCGCHGWITDGKWVPVVDPTENPE